MKVDKGLSKCRLKAGNSTDNFVRNINLTEDHADNRREQHPEENAAIHAQYH